MIHDLPRLQLAIGKPTMTRVVKGMVDRLRFGRSLDGTLSISNPSEEERNAVDHLLGRRPSFGIPLTVRLSEMERVLRDAGICDSLVDAVEAIAGPVENLRRARDLVAQQWSSLFASIDGSIEKIPQHRAWLARIRSTGLLKRCSEGDPSVAHRLLGQSVSLLSTLPQPVVTLAELATRVTGDSHALDAGTPLSTLCLLAIALQRGVASRRRADFRRELWDSVGVVVDELSAPVLVLNLRGDTDSPVGQLLNLMADAGEPCHLTVRQLRQVDESTFQQLVGDPVYVCENPSVVAAAAQRLGSRCMPLICTAGQPASAAQLLLSQLRRLGSQLRYHGDFDPSGVGITNMLIFRFSVEPWRMGIVDYLASVNGAGLRFSGRVANAVWDDQLSIHMRAHGTAVLEEAVLDSLMIDLERRHL